ncbi:septation protein A [Shewanella dokdonensis]|uniref:Inner membrane-spanning protein YciB n=1 Tax=Shewanella dokdonensis TaxID=712036 RepID=A0ABX8DFH6_9GAMM|nr:septation protein A [Shewanella dokdonensis]MCL1075022.1 septation protein A [Shewanella dokdonensis]QVK23445.1 septation protein A [Shewanella dokdonensis]
MKQLLDFLPLIIFFAVYKLYDIYVASGVLVAATALQLIMTYAIYRKLEKLHIITFVVVAIFGSLTLFLHDDVFIKWKVTIVYALMALALVVSQWLKRPVLKSMLGNELKVADHIWTRVTWYWAIFFVLCSLANIYVAFHLSQATWVNFKVFGLTAVTLLNTIVTVLYLFKHIPEEQRKELK